MNQTGTGKYERLLERCASLEPIPTVLTSRADSVRSRIASCAVAALVAHARRTKPGGH